MSFGTRVVVGLGVGALGLIVGGPVAAAAGWKLGGFVTTGNPLHLLPGGSAAADGMSIVAEVGATDAADLGGLDPGESDYRRPATNDGGLGW